MFDTPFDRYQDRSDQIDIADESDVSAPLNGTPAEDTSAHSGKRRWVIAIALVLALLASWWLLMPGASPSQAAMPVPVVTVANPLQRDVTKWDEFVGRFEASKSVDVRPQVSGRITRVHFTDGQYVQAGATLFTIDSSTYRAALAQAQAQVAQVQSALMLSKENFARAQRLIADDAVAATEIDRLQAEVRTNQAGLTAARALVRARSLDVGYTTIRAPMSGRISDRRIDAGNLVSGGGGAEATLLTTINAVDPIYFEFAGSEALFLKSRREEMGKGTQVEIRLQDETDYQWHGTLDFTDNGLDPDSGTIRARAVVRNPDDFLAPGLFGRMRLATTGTHQALLVPDEAVTTDQTRKLLLVVEKDGTVRERTVKLGPIVDGLRVVEGELKPSDRIIIKGIQMAVPGQKVRAEAGKISLAAAEPSTQPSGPVFSRASSATIAN